MILLFLGSTVDAHGQSSGGPRDVSVTSIGVQTWTDSAIRGTVGTAPPTDVDLVLGQRLRWTVAEAPGADVAALVDGRFTIDADPAEAHRLEWSQVRQLGIEVTSDQWTVDLGRHPVFRGGPRLVDGVQALYAPGSTVRIGGWGGLAPSLYTTLPELRPGGGPILSYATSSVQLSAVGELVTFNGAIDRIGVLGLGRISFERRLDLAARIDVEAAGPVGPRLVDGQLLATGTPTPSFRIDAFYDAFSSYRYIDPSDLDPDAQRFADRLSTLGIAPLVPYDELDPTLNHMVGAGLRVEPDTDGAAPRVALEGRFRANEDPLKRYLRVNPQLGVVRLGGMVDLIGDVNWVRVDDGPQLDGGLLLYVEPPDGSVSFDGSARLIAAPTALGALGWYGDLFVNVVSSRLDLLLIAGGMLSSEPDIGDRHPELGVGGFLRAAKYVRPRR